MTRFVRGAAALLLALTLGCAASGRPDDGRSRAETVAGAATPAAGTVSIPRHSSIVAVLKLAADYYQPTYAVATDVRNGWSWSTYFQGVQALFRTAGDQKYFTHGMAWGQSVRWGLTRAEFDPDSVKAGQTYYDLNRFDRYASLSAVDSRMSADLTRLPFGAYWWADSLFMGLSNWTRWAARTGNAAYLSKMDSLYRWTRDHGGSRCAGGPHVGLYDPAERLWYRDCSYVTRRGPHGRKIFWSRGNGWVLAAMAQVLATLPNGDVRAGAYRQMLSDMAGRLAGLQGADGFWRPDLTDPANVPLPETSGTALFTYALAYGVHSGLLDRATYLPVVTRAWNGLVGKVAPSGFLSGCQPVGSEPATPYTRTAPRTPPTARSPGTLHVDSPPFCVGAFLLAGSEMAKLGGATSSGHPSARPLSRWATRAAAASPTAR